VQFLQMVLGAEKYVFCEGANTLSAFFIFIGTSTQAKHQPLQRLDTAGSFLYISATWQEYSSPTVGYRQFLFISLSFSYHATDYSG
jgi:hypothetical protein